MLADDTIQIWSILLVAVYYLPVLVAAIALPWFMNAFNNDGWWYNAGRCIGLSKRLQMRRRAKWERERAEYENRRYWNK